MQQKSGLDVGGHAQAHGQKRPQLTQAECWAAAEQKTSYHLDDFIHKKPLVRNRGNGRAAAELAQRSAAFAQIAGIHVQ